MKSFIEKVWNYRGSVCSVVHTTMGHRCGYIAVPKGMKVPRYEGSEGSCGYIDLDVHGGVTFEETAKCEVGTRREICGIMVDNGTQILGFDCGHLFDASDIPLTIERFGRCIKDFGVEGAVIRTQEYCESECESMVDQILALNSADLQSIKMLT